MPLPAAPPAEFSTRATGSNEGPRGTATQPFVSVYDQDDDEPWDTPGPPGSVGAAGVGPVPTGGGFGTARIPPEPPRPRPSFRPSFATGVGRGKAMGSQAMVGIDPPVTMTCLTERIPTGHLVAEKLGTISAHGPRVSGGSSGGCTLGHRARGESFR